MAGGSNGFLRGDSSLLISLPGAPLGSNSLVAMNYVKIIPISRALAARLGTLVASWSGFVTLG